jgi:hypothetical protein
MECIIYLNLEMCKKRLNLISLVHRAVYDNVYKELQFEFVCEFSVTSF